MTLLNISAVFVGGGLGAVARYGFGTLLSRGAFPYATLAVNILGCFAIGLIVGLLLLRDAVPVWRLFLATGLMGGFTTFSAFALESTSMLQRGATGSALLYIGMSVLGCLLACYVGLKVSS